MAVFRHVSMFKWAEGLGPDHVSAVGAALDSLPAAIPEIVRYQHGPDAGVNAGTYEYVLVADFDSLESYLVYRDHPVHQAFISDHITGRVVERASAQYVVAE